MSRANLAWWCKNRDLSVASIRIRAELVQRGLRETGLQAGWFDGAAPVRSLVVSKRQDEATLRTVRRLKAGGTRIIADFCDNNFIPTCEAPRSRRKAEVSREICETADVVVAATSALAGQIVESCPGIAAPVVIGDLSDDLSVVPQPFWRTPGLALKLRGHLLWLKQARDAGVGQLLWFGNHGGKRGLSGYADLQRLLPLLEQINRHTPICLSVISNHHALYHKMMRDSRLPSRYLDWDPWTFGSLLRAHDLVLIPSQLNAFSICKTDNRIVSALKGGVPVVADRLPSYCRYENVAILGDFEDGIRRYLAEPELRQQHVTAAQRLFAACDSPQRLLRQWQQVVTGQ